MNKKKGKFYTTKNCLLSSVCLLIVSIGLSILIVNVIHFDPYTSLFRKAKTNFYDSLGIEIVSEKNTKEALFSAFTLSNVSIKQKGENKAIFTADEISFNQSFFSIVLSLSGLPVPLDASIKNGILNVQDTSDKNSFNVTEYENVKETKVPSSREKSSNEFDVVSVLKHGVSVVFDNFIVNVETDNFNITSKKIDAEIAFDKKLNFKKFNINIPELIYTSKAKDSLIINNITSSIQNSRIDINFMDTVYKDKDDVTLFNLNNLSPYIMNNYNSNKTLHLPLKGFNVSFRDFELISYDDDAEILLEFKNWSNINIQANINKFLLHLYSYGKPDIILNKFNLNYDISNKSSLSVMGNVITSPILFLRPLEGKLDIKLDNPITSPKGYLNINDIVFDEVEDIFNLSVTVDNSVVNANFLSQSINDYVSELEGKAVLNLRTMEFDSFINFNAFNGHKTRMFLPSISSVLISSNSKMNGSITLNGNGSHAFDTKGDAHLNISNLHFLNQRSSIEIDGTLNVQDGVINIGKTEARLFGFRLELDGKYNLRTTLPDFNAVFYKNDTEYARGVFAFDENEVYKGKITSLNGVISFDGDFDFNNPILTTAKGTLGVYNNRYPFDLNYNNETKLLSAITTGLTISGTAVSGGHIRVVADNLNFPRIPFIRIVDSKVNSKMDIDLSGDNIRITSSSVRFDFESGSSLDFKLDATTKNIFINDIDLKARGEVYTGAFFMNMLDVKKSFDPFNIKIGGALHSSSESSNVNISYIPTSDQVSLYINMEGFNGFSTIKGNPFDRINLSLLLESDLKKKHVIYGSINAEGNEDIESGKKDLLTLDIGFNNNILNLSNINISYGAISLSNSKAYLNMDTGESTFVGDTIYSHEKVGDNTIFKFSLEANANIKSLIDSNYKIENMTDNITGKVLFKNADFGSVFFPKSFESTLTITNNLVDIKGEVLNGEFNFKTHTFKGVLDKAFTLGFDVEGYVYNGVMDIKLSSIYLPFRYLDLLIWGDTVSFQDGLFSGDIRMVGDTSNPQFYGTLKAKSAVMWNLWAENEICTIVNPKIIAFGNVLNIPPVDVFARNQKTGRVSKFKAGCKLHLERWDLPLIELVLDVEKNNSVSVSVPLPVPNMNIDIDEVWGHFEMDLYYLNYPDIRLNLTAKDGTFAPPARYPKWIYDPDSPPSELGRERSFKYTKLDGTLTIEKGVSFMYPNIETPFINAAVGENQVGKITYSEGKFSVDTDISIRSGEIFYFQKNFLITEGTLSWHPMTNMGEILESTITNAFLKQYARDFAGLNLSLSARMKDFDANGNPVDIYLLLDNATLDNLNPRFSSSTGLSDSEILLLLGQNILPTSTYSSTGISSLAYMSSVALDVVTKLGVIQPLGKNTFADTMERALGLDMFSVRQRIFYNVIADVIPGGGVGTAEYGSSFARYLNGTTIFLGKNITDSLFFQATIHFLTSDTINNSRKVKNLFIEGLTGDAEFSFEWNTPLATISVFTNPSELSFLDFLNNIGINIKRHFIL